MFTALRRSLALFALPALAIVAVVAPASANATPVGSGSVSAAPISAPTQGIIMSDGRICNPRWGC
jgi:hypothetical protein